MTQIFPELMTGMSSLISNLSRIIKKNPALRHNVMNLPKTKQQAKPVKAPREKELTSRDTALTLVDGSQQQQWNIFKMLN